jgi:lipid II:glycine glycyltransferase (peptidoglycan interpeptide bridge formation enzyme)
MEVKPVSSDFKTEFNMLASHPLQSWEWGDFRMHSGIETIRLGAFQKKKLIETVQMTMHPVPSTKWTIGYIPKGTNPSSEMFEKLVQLGKERNCIFIKLEPNVLKSEKTFSLRNTHLVLSPHPLFTNHSFQLDLTKPEEELLKNMHPKTRYNIRVAQKNQISVQEDNSPEAFVTYLELMAKTTQRQKYFAHTKAYHQQMWDTLFPTGIAHLLTATYTHEGKTHTLAAWVLFLFNGILYYPYGASSDLYRNTMASNAIMWEAIRFGKRHNAQLFDMWGSLGPNPDPHDPWYGFHRFKQGYGARLVEFVGSFDLVIHPRLYKIYNRMYSIRQFFLKIKRIFPL